MHGRGRCMGGIEERGEDEQRDEGAIYMLFL